MTTTGQWTVGDDRIAIEEVLYRYASSVDSAQMHQLHDVLHPDLQAQYGNGEPVEGADAVITWMTDFTKTCGPARTGCAVSSARFGRAGRVGRPAARARRRDRVS
ncbi:hypothetical protein FXW78_23235 [Rhodococcus opacus]|nr:hypothetical protein [Rhodococcus opacus]